MKYLKIILTVFLCLIIISGFFTERRFVKTEYMLDTVITITAYGKNAKEAADDAFNEIKRIERLFSAFSGTSEISKINSSASDGFYKTDSEVFSILKRCLELSEKTNGAFDITLKPVSDLWGIGTPNARVPEKHEIEEALKKTGYENLELDEENQSVRFKIPGMAIDLGAIVKGYASEKAAAILKENGIKSAVLDLGGNIAVIGKMPLSLPGALKEKAFSRPFVVGIQNPNGQRGDIIKKITADEDIFIITSGGYERFFEKNGKKYHHIINPETGYPLNNGFLSATVITKSGTDGDALSTAAFITGEASQENFGDLTEKIILIDSSLKLTEYGKE